MNLVKHYYDFTETEGDAVKVTWLKVTRPVRRTTSQPVTLELQTQSVLPGLHWNQGQNPSCTPNSKHSRENTNSFGLDQKNLVKHLASLHLQWKVYFFWLHSVLVLKVSCWCPETCYFYGIKTYLLFLILCVPSGPPCSVQAILSEVAFAVSDGFQGTPYIQINFSYSFWFSAVAY